MNEHTVSIIVSVIGLVGILITSVATIVVAMLHKKTNTGMADIADAQKLANQYIETINDAVNHRHQKAGPNAPKLYDLAISNDLKIDDLTQKTNELIEWKNDYSGGPLDDGEKVEAFVKETRDAIADLSKRPPCLLHHLDEDETG